MAIDPRVLSVPALVHGRVLLDAVDGAASLVVGFHGYGQLAEDHLEELRRLRGDHSWALAAVQALHPFYRRSDGTVAAGWMTRLDREQAIADNVAYVA
ncbi:MAG TPA: phospholipase, partial [Thermoanaerobaculia bacterium]|nr:phospholipase [Thermoanaerobaculia bacterium]